MRLTLRTLLAFLDGILEAEDQEDIGHKVKDSEFATQLVHRTRDVVRRMRLEAPEVVGTGVCLDPNSVAEYLDNTLAPERLEEFEKNCLESDVYLAEVGSCHHILTMILGEPATVDPASRERMYRLGSENPEVAAAAAESEAPPHQDGDSRQRAKPEVPSYLRESQGSPLRVALVVGLLAAAIVGVLAMINPGLFGLQGADDSQQVAQGEIDKPETGKDPAATGGPSADTTTDPAGQPAVPPGGAGAPEQPDATPDEGALPVTSPDDAATSGVATSGPGGATTAVSESPVDAPAADGAPPVASIPTGEDGLIGDLVLPTEPPGDAVPGDTVGGDTVAADTSSAETVPENTTASDPVPADGAPAPGAVAATDESTTADPVPADAVAASPVPADGADGTSEASATRPARTFGKLLSEGQVLLRWNPPEAVEDSEAVKAGRWIRLNRQDLLREGDKLLVLPTYRPMIIVGNTTVELAGGTLIELTGIDADNVREVTVHYGRLVILSYGNPNAHLRLSLNSHQGMATLVNEESTLAVELRPYRRPGSDPAEVTSFAAIDLYGARGEVLWEEDGEVLPLVGPVRHSLAVHPEDKPRSAEEIPGWIEESQLLPLDRRASSPLAQRLRKGFSNKTIRRSLEEQVGHRLPEVRNLAIRCCAHIGHYDPVVAALDDKEFRSGWTSFTRSLRDAFDRDPQGGQKIKEALQRDHPVSGPRLYRLLWGFSDDQLLSEGEAKKLVQGLDDDELIVRVMSFWNLEDITGVRYNYRPDYSASKRRQSVARWRAEEKKQSIVHEKSRPPRGGAAPKAPAKTPPAAPAETVEEDGVS